MNKKQIQTQAQAQANEIEEATKNIHKDAMDLLNTAAELFNKAENLTKSIIALTAKCGLLSMDLRRSDLPSKSTELPP